MASPSSPTSSCSSAHSSAFSSSKFSDLPVMALREKIVEKILDNRVTLIVGETGCGKSSQIPQFLLEANVKPILCTQPRRFAVVAVAKMVAQARNSELGGEVGYHIGHSKHLSPRSIDGQCKNGNLNLALEMYQKMLRRGIKPDLVTYNTLINGLCKVGDLKEARKLVKEMNTRGFKPDKIDLA